MKHHLKRRKEAKETYWIYSAWSLKGLKIKNLDFSEEMLDA